MTYDATEKSDWDGDLVELYEFKLGTTTWRHTSGDQSFPYGGWTYEPQQIKRSKIEQGNEINRSDLKLTVARDHVVANLFLAQPPGGVVTVTIGRLHRSDPDTEAVVLWLGRITSVAWKGSEAVMDCEPVWTSVQASGLRRLYNLECPWTLFSSDCRANQLSYQLLGTVSAASGLDLDVPGAAGQPDGWYKGGFVVWHSPTGAANTRWVTEHVGTILTLASPFYGISGSDPVEVYPGCNRTVSVCINKFDNILNYGGFPFIPEVNPFDTKVL